MILRKALYSDLSQCLEIENTLSINPQNFTNRGFLRGVETIETYSEFLKNDIFYVAELNSAIVAFLLVLRPGNQRSETLKINKSRFKIYSPELLESKDLYWGAKIAVLPSYLRSGVASKLTQFVLKQEGDHDIITTTAAIPIKNAASEKFHLALGFRKIGTYHAEDEVTIHDVMYRAAKV